METSNGVKLDITEIQKQVFLQRPVLKEITYKFGAISLMDYVRNKWEVPSFGPDPLFLDVLKTEALALYGPDLAEQLSAQLFKKPLVSTIDHLGIWNHPIFVNSSLIFSLRFAQNELMPVLATESISLNNITSWSASLIYHDENLNYKRQSFLPDRLKTLPVFSAPAITALDIGRFQKSSGNRFNRLLDILNLADDCRVGSGFAPQACRASGRLWEEVFPSAPRLSYLPLETIISRYLLKIFQDPQNFFSQTVLTRAGRELWNRFFKDGQTFMFWGIDKKGRRQPLAELPEKPADVLRLIEARTIYPSSPFCFMVLLKAGLACAGGFNQTTWLTEVKEKFLKMLAATGNGKSMAKIQTVPTQNFGESSLAWLKLGGKYVMPAALDLYLSGKDCYRSYVQLAEKISLSQSLQLAMPTIYSVVVPKAEWQPGFSPSFYQSRLFESLNMGNLLDKLLS